VPDEPQGVASLHPLSQDHGITALQPYPSYVLSLHFLAATIERLFQVAGIRPQIEETEEAVVVQF
jgi:hypothetical protein